MSVRHIVMWRVAGTNADERRANAERVRAAFEAMRGRVPGLRRLEVGLDMSRADHACDMVLLTDFDDAAALAAYATHPEHLRAKAAAGNLRIERYQVDFMTTADG
jgi:heme-degrading monooxygenase HmoA